MQARRLPARHGFLWLIASFRLFQANPPVLTALTMGYFFVIFAIGMLPYLGRYLVPLVLPALVVIVANGCRAIERGGGLGGITMTQSLERQRIPLVQLGGLHLLGSIVIEILSSLMGGGGIPLFGPGQKIDHEEVLATLARQTIIALPISTALWFAPLLTAWDEVPPLKSVFFSFVAAWRNWRAFAIFGLSLTIVAVALPGLILVLAGAISAVVANILTIALMLAITFVIAPVTMASMYVSYRDVFHSADSEGE